MDSIDVFPNTGHHFHFVPVPQGFIDKYPQVRDYWNRLRMKGWVQHKELNWVRYRADVYAPQGSAEQLGIWVAIESNLGTRTRGIVHDSRRNIPATPIDQLEYVEGQTPYAFIDEGHIPEERLVRLPPIMLRLKGDKEDRVALNLPPVVWQRMAAETPIDVDLIIDFGNTRTVAMLLEHSPSQPFNAICHPLRFVPRGTPYPRMNALTPSDDPYSIVDSWIVLNETMFSGLEPPANDFKPVRHLEIEERVQRPGWFGTKTSTRVAVAETKYLPQLFVELSPAVLGGGNAAGSARQILRLAVLEHSPNFFLSSPKRYVWDSDPIGRGGHQYWHVQLNNWNTQLANEFQAGLPEVRGTVLLLMDPDGRYWDLDHEPPPNERSEYAHRPHANDRPIHPRRDVLTWAGLGILEMAHRQISSPEYRRARKPFVKRRIRTVVVTFPSGWTIDEIENYRRQWQKAVNIYAIGHLQDRRCIEDGGDRPTLLTDMDEAVASQLPIVYSEMSLMAGGESWISLMGRGEGTESVVRVMNLDIGGGTTDAAVVEYQDRAPGSLVDLRAKLLFKNSSTCAGDSVVKRVIETVLLPCMANNVFLDEPKRQLFDQLFRNPWAFVGRDPTVPAKIARIVRLVFWPIVISWLRELSESRFGDSVTKQPQAPRDMRDGNDLPIVDSAILDELNSLGPKLVGVPMLLSPDDPLNYDQKRIKDAIVEVFEPLFRTTAKVVSGFDCDLVVISGKSSELPPVRALIEKHMPILFQRIIFAHGYSAGEWYPFADGGKIGDAKTATVVGAALAQAIRSGMVSGWQLTMDLQYLMMDDNYWALMGPLFEESVFLAPGEQQVTFKAVTNVRIGRKRLLSAAIEPEQVYVIRWRPERDRNMVANIELTVERVKKPGYGETLKLIDVQGQDHQGKPVSRDDIELHLCTLPDNEFWMDNPSFAIQWN